MSFLGLSNQKKMFYPGCPIKKDVLNVSNAHLRLSNKISLILSKAVQQGNKSFLGLHPFRKHIFSRAVKSKNMSSLGLSIQEKCVSRLSNQEKCLKVI